MTSTLQQSEVLLMLVALLFVRPVPSSGSAGRHVGESATCGYSRSFGFFMDGRS